LAGAGQPLQGLNAGFLLDLLFVYAMAISFSYRWLLLTT
jgi:hypothetical protein